jgi:hypothetical protein
MKLTFNIGPQADPYFCGELLLHYFNRHKRWGYYTTEFSDGMFVLGPVESEDLVAKTLCAGCFAKQEEVDLYQLPWLGLTVHLHWDGDGTIVIEHKAEGWTLVNNDCKKDSWEWIDDDSWVYNLPENYYEQD